jgi:predicted DCC family thiol-disulfide oxidoreductase YuxK
MYVVFFDGVCNLCNSSVNFIIERDKKNVFRFASLQSSFGAKYATTALGNYDSVILLEGDKVYYRSDAALRILKHLGGIYSWAYCFIIIPKFLRNAVYDFIARHRYQWFGKSETCRVPTAELKEKFIE